MTNAADSYRRLSIFLCHSKSDKEAVRKLYEQLRSDGFDPWFDEESLLPGANWPFEIKRRIKEIDVVAVCLSPGAITKKGYLQAEIKYALDVAEQQPEGTIFIIPIKLAHCDMPDRLSHLHWVNLFEDRGHRLLKAALIQRARELGRSTDPRLNDVSAPRDIAASITLYGGFFLTPPPDSPDSSWDLGWFEGNITGPSMRVAVDGDELSTAARRFGGPKRIDVLHSTSKGTEESGIMVSGSLETYLLRRSALYEGEVVPVDEQAFDVVLRFHSGRFVPSIIQPRRFYSVDPYGNRDSRLAKELGPIAHCVSVQYALAPGDSLILAEENRIFWSTEECKGIKGSIDIQVVADDTTREKFYCRSLGRRSSYWMPQVGVPPTRP
jgi:hypothetical protein